MAERDRGSPLLLVPQPRSLELVGSGPPADRFELATATDGSLPAQGYRLVVDERGARIDHRDDAGRRYGLATLAQIRAQPRNDGRLHGARIDDHPEVATRGFMLDISRDRVPTRETLDRYVELLALARYNQLQLYIEHTFAHQGAEVVWRDASPLTAEDLRWLDDRCAGEGIELVVNRNAFGHMERWLRHESYRARAESPDGAELFPGLRMPPSVLAPTDDNARFALELVREQLACVRSRRVNIGCDETFELGRGVSASACAALGPGRVYFDHVLRLVGPLLDDGYEVQIWADVLRRHPELARELPDGVVPVAWHYEPPTPPDRHPEVPLWLAEALSEVGIDTDASGGFEANVAPLVDAGVGFWLASGTADWNSFVGRLDAAIANQIDAVETARRHGSEGVIVTAWGDNGHHHPPSVTFAALVHGGAVAWGLDANRNVDLAAVLDARVFGGAGAGIGSVLVEAGNLWHRTGRRALNASPLAASLLAHLPLLVTGEADPDQVLEVLADLDRLDAELAGARPGGVDAAVVVHEVATALALARQGAWRLLGSHGPSPTTLADHLGATIDHQCTAWLSRARPGGLDDSLSHLARTLDADRAHG